MLKPLFCVTVALIVTACGSTPKPVTKQGASSTPAVRTLPPSAGTSSGATPFRGAPSYTPVPKGWSHALYDKAQFYQKDPRWARDRLGNTTDTMAAYGCLVTATAMALSNLGFQTDPKDFNARMGKVGGFNARGWMVWSGIEKVTANKATFKFYNTVSDEIIEGCMDAGFYPLARFILPNGRTHWAVIVGKSSRGYHMRDPLRESSVPLIFPRGADAFKSIRCVGLKG